MNTLTLTAGQVSQIIEIGKGTRVTSSGNGTIEFYPGSLADAKNGGTFEAWPKGSSAGSVDAMRGMCIRATATGAMTVTLEEGANDFTADDVYWDSEYARLSTDSNNNTVLVGADGRSVGVGPTRIIKASNSWLDDQPYAVTNPVRSAGKLVCRFLLSEWTAYSGTTVLATHTGYDAYGVKDGSLTAGIGVGPVSITGHPTMIKCTPGDDSNEGLYPTTFSTPVKTVDLNGKVGMWVYCESKGASITLELSNTSTLTNGLSITWTGSLAKVGWNFLVFVMRDPQAYVIGSGVSEYHPEGVIAIAKTGGTGATSDILNYPIAAMRITINNTGITGKNFYFDSIWTDFDVKAQYLVGFDSADQSIIDYAIPYMRHKGYAAVNFTIYDGSTRIHTNYAFNDRVGTIYDAGWEVVNHTAMHLPGTVGTPTMATLTDAAEIAYELKTLQAAMLAQGWTRGQHFYVSPQSQTSALSERVIGDLGYPLQRHGVGGNNIQITPWGIPNPRNIGGFAMGATATVFRLTTGGLSAQTTGLHEIAKARLYVDCIIAYGATWMPYSHGIETASDDGSGNQAPIDSNIMKQSHFELLMDYLHAKEDAGLITGLDGSDQLWYGANAQ